MSYPSLVGTVIHRGYDRESCWVHARCGFLPREGGKSAIVVTLQKCTMGTSIDMWDVFSGLWTMRSDDGGHTWQPPVEQPALRRWREPGDIEVAISDFTPQWHSATGRLLGIGHTCRYRGGKLMDPPRPRETAYSVFDAAQNTWGPARLLEMPDPDRFFSAGAGSIQWTELPNGELLLPIYFKTREASETSSPTVPAPSQVIVLRCRFDGERLHLLEMGNELNVHAYRGLGEPSLAAFGGRHWMTLRNGERAYVSVSDDGLHFEPPVPWRFDDGAELGSHDTQQHWAQAGGRLFLVYTRKGLGNDHIVRNRAPLLIAEVDPERRRILKATERIAIPDRGAQLGNFGVGQRTGGEAWICASEWMENAGEWNREVWDALKAKFPEADLEKLAAMPGRCGLCELSGSDNSIHLVKVAIPQMQGIAEPGR